MRNPESCKTVVVVIVVGLMLVVRCTACGRQMDVAIILDMSGSNKKVLDAMLDLIVLSTGHMLPNKFRNKLLNLLLV